MKISIHASGFAATAAIEEFVRRKLQTAFGRISAPIRRIVVRMADINADRGGVDKRCQLQVQISRMTDVHIEDTHSDLYFAISRAVDRAARTTQRRVDRLRTLRTRGPALGSLGELQVQPLPPTLQQLLRLPKRYAHNNAAEATG